ncbi:MAG: O-antigen polysaccharide polymerase Wzy [Lysobacteraceae bacterium]|nr:MAG: O-antigen polysaccharide polymerase Wzy [Xanthomonadaceae bacterium]
MDVFLAVLIALLCGGLLIRIAIKPDAPLFHVALMALFTLGYLVLPVMLKGNSGLASYAEREIAGALGIHGLYFLALLAGYFFFLARSGRRRSIDLPRIATLVQRYPARLFYLCLALYLAYFSTNELTSYSAEDFEAYFQDRSLFSSLLAAIAVYCQALMAICLVAAIGNSKRAVVTPMIAAYAVMLVLLLSVGQRLAMIAPCIMLVMAFGLAGQGRRALKIMLATVVALALVSPFAVYLREAESGSRGKDKIVEVGGGFSYGDDPITTAVTSVAERADLVLNTLLLKGYIDRTGYVGPQFYYSVLVSPVPRLIIGNKPALLSGDGTPADEISVLAWRLDKGQSTGSLTAFGGITAYRQGGWLAVIIDGVLVGVLGAFMYRWLGSGGPGGQMFYVVLVPLMVVKRVPASLFEALAEILPMLVFIALACVVDRLAGRRLVVRNPHV